MDTFLSEYQIALRCAFYAGRKHYAQARVYISLDHCWNMLLEPNEKHFYRGKAFLDALQRNVQAEGDFDWGVAYHPFPEDLKRADFWNDTTAIQSFDTGKITFRNVEILAAYLKQKQFLHRGKIRHIILSEQGLCSGDMPEGERLQADALCWHFIKSKRYLRLKHLSTTAIWMKKTRDCCWAFWRRTDGENQSMTAFLRLTARRERNCSVRRVCA